MEKCKLRLKNRKHGNPVCVAHLLLWTVSTWVGLLRDSPAKEQLTLQSQLAEEPCPKNWWSGEISQWVWTCSSWNPVGATKLCTGNAAWHAPHTWTPRKLNRWQSLKFLCGLPLASDTGEPYCAIWGVCVSVWLYQVHSACFLWDIKIMKILVDWS